MTSVLAGLTRGGWPFLVAWVFPSAIACSLYVLVAIPLITNKKIDWTASGLAIGFSSVALGLLLSALASVLFRFIEGYYLPKRWYTWLRDRQLSGKNKLRVEDERMASDEAATGGSNARGQLVRDKLRQFPAENEDIVATRFGNALRAFETYGKNRYQLDTIIFWDELIAVVPKVLREAEDEARAGVSFFVSLTYLAYGFGIACLVTASIVSSGWRSLVISGVISIVTSYFWYHMAVVATRPWQSAVQAIVNTGRRDLAAKFGLILPKTLNDERRMWRYLFFQVYEDFSPGWSEVLDRFRVELSPDSTKENALLEEPDPTETAASQPTTGGAEQRAADAR